MSKLYIFNPTNELAIADGGKGYIPSKYLAEFESNLDTLPFLFASPDDYVLVDNIPDKNWLESFSSREIPLPKFLKKEDLMLLIKSQEVVIEDITPWGWSPRMIKRVEEIIRLSPSIDLNLPNYRWTSKHKSVYGRETALKALKFIVQDYPNREKLIHDNMFPVKACKVAEIDDFLKLNKKIVVKSPHSSSGKGIVMLQKPVLNRQNVDWILGAIKQSGYVMVEPFFNILNHFSIQFYNDKAQCRRVAFGAFSCNSKGGYECNFIGGVEVLPKVKQFVNDIDIGLIADILSDALKKLEIGNYYNGYLGVDMFLCEHQNGELFLHPCVEINLRQNMGLAAHYLLPWIADNHVGRFRIINKTCVPNNDIIGFINSNSPQWSKNKLQGGLIALTPPLNKNHVAIAEICCVSNNENVLTFSDIIPI